MDDQHYEEPQHRRGDRGPFWASYIWTSSQFVKEWHNNTALGRSHPQYVRQMVWGTDMHQRQYIQVFSLLHVGPSPLALDQGTVEMATSMQQEIEAEFGPLAQTYPRSGDTVALFYRKPKEIPHPGTVDMDEREHGIDLLTPWKASVVLHPLRTLMKDDDYRRPTGLLVAKAVVINSGQHIEADVEQIE